MAVPLSEKLLTRARNGERLATRDRRNCVTYIIATEPETTNVAMAEIFQVTERTIRDDKMWIRQERSRFIREEDVSLVIGDIAASFDNEVRDLQVAKRNKECKPGTRTYMEYCKSIFDMQLRKVKALQDLGYYPRNLGTLTMEKFEYTASVSVMEGGAPAIPGRAVKDQELIEAEFSEVEDEEPKPSEAAVEAYKMLKAPEDPEPAS